MTSEGIPYPPKNGTVQTQLDIFTVATNMFYIIVTLVDVSFFIKIPKSLVTTRIHKTIQFLTHTRSFIVEYSHASVFSHTIKFAKLKRT